MAGDANKISITTLPGQRATGLGSMIDRAGGIVPLSRPPFSSDAQTCECRRFTIQPLPGGIDGRAFDLRRPHHFWLCALIWKGRDLVKRFRASFADDPGSLPDVQQMRTWHRNNPGDFLDVTGEWGGML